MRDRARADGNNADGPHGPRRSVDDRPLRALTLRDSYGRVADDLRISITDRCNFRCIYCMPAEGLKWLKRDDLLRFEEIARLAGLFVDRYVVRAVPVPRREAPGRDKVRGVGVVVKAAEPNHRRP